MENRINLTWPEEKLTGTRVTLGAKGCFGVWCHLNATSGLQNIDLTHSF